MVRPQPGDEALLGTTSSRSREVPPLGTSTKITCEIQKWTTFGGAKIKHLLVEIPSKPSKQEDLSVLVPFLSTLKESVANLQTLEFERCEAF